MRLEVAIVRSCGLTIGNGAFDHDWPIAASFSACCNAVAGRSGFTSWPGCRAYGLSRLDPGNHTYLEFQVFGTAPTYYKRHHWSGGAFGDYGHSFVREGIYVQYLPSWYASLTAENIMLIPHTNLFGDTSNALRSLVYFATGSVDNSMTSKIEKISAKIADIQINSKTSVHEGMTEETQQFLDAFYLPFNRELQLEYGVSV